ncbi:hypothetical protein EYC95_16515 [Pseudomonas sp. BGI-2]|nr:hypothetical protein EYC95_16515 [Pseudomonas sp. BGI-2]
MCPHRSPVGAGLLAKAVVQSTSMLNDPPPSRASPLPQGSIVMMSPYSTQKPSPIKKRRHPGSAFINPLFFLLILPSHPTTLPVPPR